MSHCEYLEVARISTHTFNFDHNYPQLVFKIGCVSCGTGKQLRPGFGSGDYVTKSEASDVISDVDGRWIRFDLGGKSDQPHDCKQIFVKQNLFLVHSLLIICSMRHHVILENQKKLPEHLSEVDIFNKVQVNFYRDIANL